MKSTLLGLLRPGLGQGRTGLRKALGALGILSVLAVLALSALGGSEPFSAQAGAQPGHSLAGAALSASSGTNARPARIAAPAVCGSLSFAPAVNYPVGASPHSEV